MSAPTASSPLTRSKRNVLPLTGTPSSVTATGGTALNLTVIFALDRVKALAAQHPEWKDQEPFASLLKGDVRQIGQVLHESWQRKKRLAKGISNERIDRLYQLALEHGAIGGKIAGAGGGGFLLLFCEPEHQPDVTRVLEAEGLARMTFHFGDGGAQVLVNSMPEIPGLHYPEGRWAPSGVVSA